MKSWNLEKIAVVGAGIVGIPMAALLAQARIRQGSDRPSRVVLIQRLSKTSGWKVRAINSGKSPIGGLEPDLGAIIAETTTTGLLSASCDYSDVRDADLILVCVQTDKTDFAPDYGPLFDALSNIAPVLKKRPAGKTPLLIFESTLAPTTMNSVIKDYFAQNGLLEGRDILLGNSPNRVMPGRLVERIKTSDKIIGGLSPITPKMIEVIYSKIVTAGKLHLTNCITAEIAKTLENAYRDVRIAYTSEIARYCDSQNLDFHRVRREVNERLSWSDRASENSDVVPSGGLLIPTIGVGGHCLPKDGFLLLWRLMESGEDMSASLFLEARRINDESPGAVIGHLEKSFGDLDGRFIALMGAAYRPDSEDTRYSPSLALGRQLLEKGCRLILHDPFVKLDDQNLVRSGLDNCFIRDVEKALQSAEIVIFCVAHRVYRAEIEGILRQSLHSRKIYDGCNLFQGADFYEPANSWAGIGKGKTRPSPEFIDFVHDGFKAVEHGIANEVFQLTRFFNENYVHDDFNRTDFLEVRKLVGTCITGCFIPEPVTVAEFPVYQGFYSRLAKNAKEFSTRMNRAF